MTKFTKGEWSVSELEDNVDYIRVRGTVPGARFKIANVIDVNHHLECNTHVYAKEKQQAIANAHLIAAAPDMYGMLESIAKNMLTTDGGCIEDMLAIEMLLKKARGETGMSSSEANELYQSNEQVNKGEFAPEAISFTSGQEVFIAQINTNAGIESHRYYIKQFWCNSGHQNQLNELGLLFNNKIDAESKCRSLVGLPPLTPPIELIDGKAYQFDVRDKGGVVCGIYHEYDKKLHVGPTHYFDLMSATNIKPLTVKDEE